MLDVMPLEKALGQLETSLGYLRSEMGRGNAGLHGQFRAAAIQGIDDFVRDVRFLVEQLRARNHARD